MQSLPALESQSVPEDRPEQFMGGIGLPVSLGQSQPYSAGDPRLTLGSEDPSVARVAAPIATFQFNLKL